MIRQHYASLYAVAVKFVGSPDIAKDITQEVLIRLWEKQDRYTELESVENFLFTLVKREALNYLRGAQRERERYKQLPRVEGDEYTILNRLIEEETNQIMIQAINLLPEKSARIMRLLLSGYDNKEISLALGVSINTVKTLKYGAIRKLREHLLKRHGNKT